MNEEIQLSKLKRQASDNKAFLEDVIGDRVETSAFRWTPFWRSYLAPLSQFRRSVIFTCPHWGSFHRSFARIGFSLPEGDGISVMRGRDWEIDEQALWEKFRIRSDRDIDIFKVFSLGDVEKFSSSLMNGRHAFVLFDLHSEYGRPKAVNVLNWTFQFASGWTLIAYRSKSIVVVFRPSSVDRRDDGVVGVIDPNGYASYFDFLKSCLKICGDCLGSLLLEEPGYWFNSASIDKYNLQRNEE